MKSPAEQLKSRYLDGGWRVVDQITLSSNHSGGNFSAGYVVENKDGRKGFLKALDYSRALKEPDVALALRAMTEAYVFERTLHEQCKASRLSRVVTAIDSGNTRIDPGLAGVVEYLIFELGEGDIRKHVDHGNKIDLAWILRTVHNVSTGLFQLHKIGIAHQDVKPSNIVVFEKGDVSKLTDLGRAVSENIPTPSHIDRPYAGDPGYAPLELKYGHKDSRWEVHRYGCDLYLLGSMIVFLLTKHGMTSNVILKLNKAHRPKFWSGDYFSVLPYVRHAFNEVVNELKDLILVKAFEDEIIEVVRELCDPDPRLRGHSKNLGTANQYSLERYISQFNLLTKRAEIYMMTGKKI